MEMELAQGCRELRRTGGADRVRLGNVYDVSDDGRGEVNDNDNLSYYDSRENGKQ